MSNVMQGLNLAMYGMGSVFIFLILLTFVVYGLSALVAMIEARMPAQPQPGTGGATPAPAQPGQHDTHLLAVITAAVARYRDQHQSGRK